MARIRSPFTRRCPARAAQREEGARARAGDTCPQLLEVRAPLPGLGQESWPSASTASGQWRATGRPNAPSASRHGTGIGQPTETVIHETALRLANGYGRHVEDDASRIMPSDVWVRHGGPRVARRHCTGDAMKVVMQRCHTFEPNLSVKPMGVLLGEVPGHRDVQLRHVRYGKLVYCARILMN
jgi:hypothetical protein